MNRLVRRAMENRFTNVFRLPSAERRSADVSHTVILYVEDLCVSFDGYKALDHLNLYVDNGELRCLIGANGAGKTTLMDVITGKTPCDSGQVWLGQNINLLAHDEAEIARFGIGRKFQKPSVFEAHTVLANLELALPAAKTPAHALFARITGEESDRLDEVLEFIGLKEYRNRSSAALSHGQKQWLEIGMLLASDPSVLLIDEPVAGMTPAETEKTAELLVTLAGDRTVIVVEHDMAFIRRIARTVTVLHQGSVLAEGSMDEIQNDPKVIQVYLGVEP
jgi:urea transport system ATP-binding protein